MDAVAITPADWTHRPRPQAADEGLRPLSPYAVGLHFGRRLRHVAMLTDDDLLQLARGSESERVERKPSGSDRRGIRRSICAFANDLAGHDRPGVIFVGLGDDGSCAGLAIDDRLLHPCTGHGEGAAMKTIAFFNNKGGVGKTSLVYHLAWMYSDLGLNVLTADPDPQANLTTMFLDEDRLEVLWPNAEAGQTVLGPVLPLLEGEGGIGVPYVERVGDIGLLAGDLALSVFEDELSNQWHRCLAGEKRAFHVIGAFHQVIQRAAQAEDADIVLIDVGPNLGAVNRSALIAADHIVVPLAPDLFSLKGMLNLGPRLRDWRQGWSERLLKTPAGLTPPTGHMQPAGYVVMQHAVRLDRPVKAYATWMARIPGVYPVLAEAAEPGITVADDPHCLATLRHYGSLMPLAQEARKPMFHLKPADGAIGAHVQAVQSCYTDFQALAYAIAERCGVSIPI
jgi:chromosome partitioning protein